MEETKRNDLWQLVVVNKKRVIKKTDKYVLIRVGKEEDKISTIIGTIFLRKKETDECLFFSIPKNFQFNFRTDKYDVDKKQYVKTDELVAYEGCKNLIYNLRNE